MMNYFIIFGKEFKTKKNAMFDEGLELNYY